MNKLIEKLKDNEAHKIFADMSNEEQQVLWSLMATNALQHLTEDMNWCQKSKESKLFNLSIYRIKPDYQPEPEFVDLEVVRHAEGTVEQTWWLGVWADKRAELPHAFTHLHCLVSLPNFECFWNKIPSPVDSENTFYCLGLVTKMRNAGHKVYARFRGQGQ